METLSFSEVGKTIKRILDEQGMTQQALADAIGVSKQVMHKIVAGTKAINVTEIAAIATALGTTVDVLLTPAAVTQRTDFLEVQNEQTRKKILFLQDVMHEILFLEEVVHAHDTANRKQ